MWKWLRLPLVLTVLTGAALLALPVPAQAQECMVGTAGPVSLTSRQTLTVCATNLDAARTVHLGVAFYDAFNAREPQRLEFFDLVQGGGTCTSFRPTQESFTAVARTGYLSAPEDPAKPLALSAQISRSEGLGGLVEYIPVYAEPGVAPPPPPPV